MIRRIIKIKFLLILSLLITAFILLLNFVFSGFDFQYLEMGNMMTIFLYVAVLSVVNALFFIALEKKMNWETQRKERMILGISGSIFLTMAAYILCRMFDQMLLRESLSF